MDRDFSAKPVLASLDDADYLVLKGFKSPAVTEKAESCRICLGDHQHTVRCPFLDFVPPGSTLGPDYLVKCDVCGYEQLQPTESFCWKCCNRGGRAVEASTFDERRRNDLAEAYSPEIEYEYIDHDSDSELPADDPAYSLVEIEHEYIDLDRDRELPADDPEMSCYLDRDSDVWL